MATKTLCSAVKPNFSTDSSSSAVKKCPKNPCVKARQEQDALIAAVAQRTQSLTGRPVVQTGKLPGDFGPQVYSADASPCLKQSFSMGQTIRRYNRYRDAMPAARAANDVNQVGDKPGSQSKGAPCLTRLPDDAAGLNKALGLKPGTIKDGDLRNDTTGFRAAMYCDESTEPPKYFLVARDTQPHSLVDWKTNIDNGAGKDSDQYYEMRQLATTLKQSGTPFDLAGYSKGGGLAQEAGLVAPDSKIYVFNSAGLSDASMARTGARSFSSLSSRTNSFSSEGDFLTYMNNTSDPNQQVANATYLRDQLQASGGMTKPIGIDYRNPETLAAQNAVDQARAQANAYYQAGLMPPQSVVEEASKIVDPSFENTKAHFVQSLNQMLGDAEQQRATGQPFRLFPPVRSDNQETVPGSMNWKADWLGANKPEANLGRLYQHQLSQVVGPMEKTMDSDSTAMCEFLKQCP